MLSDKPALKSFAPQKLFGSSFPLNSPSLVSRQQHAIDGHGAARLRRCVDASDLIAHVGPIASPWAAARATMTTANGQYRDSLRILPASFSIFFAFSVTSTARMFSLDFSISS